MPWKKINSTGINLFPTTKCMNDEAQVRFFQTEFPCSEATYFMA